VKLKCVYISYITVTAQVWEQCAETVLWCLLRTTPIFYIVMCCDRLHVSISCIAVPAHIPVLAYIPAYIPVPAFIPAYITVPAYITA
jgi:hypothetical protein